MSRQLSVRRRLALALSMLCIGAAEAQPVTYVIDPTHTQVTWAVQHFGTSTQRGRFTGVQGSVVLDRGAARGEVSISIATASVSSGVPALDAMLRGRQFLASKEFPQAYFVATRLHVVDGHVSELRGEFTLHGVSLPLSLRAARFACRQDRQLQREVCGGDFEAEMQRSDFGITYGLPFVGDAVRLHIAVEAVREP